MMNHKLKKLLPNFKKKALTTCEALSIAGMLAFGAQHTHRDTHFQPYKIIKPHRLAEQAALKMSQNTTLKLEWIDHDHISVNDEVLLHEDALAKYPKDRRAITAFVQYHWYLDEQKQTPVHTNDFSQGIFNKRNTQSSLHDAPTMER